MSLSISQSLLQDFGASLNRFKKGEYIFHENWVANFYFQMECGSVKMFNYGEKNDYIQGIFTDGESFGEPPLLADFPYPANAIALTDCKVWVLKKDNYLKLLESNPEVHFTLTKVLAQRLYYKNNLLNAINTKEPTKRLLTIIDYFKNKSERKSDFYELPFTRQALADMSGLRVETVIKKVILLAENGELKLSDHKIFRKW